MFTIKREFENKQLFINENGTIKEVTFVSMKVIKQEDKHIVIWKYKHNGVEGEITTEYGTCPLYSSVEDAIQECSSIICHESKMAIRSSRSEIRYDNSVNKFYVSAYVFRNGTIKFENLEIATILYERKYYGALIELVEDIQYYPTKEECLAFNKITEIDYNGNESVYSASGYMQDFVAYTDEQKKAIKALTKAFENAKASGLQWLISDYGISFINVKGIDKYKISDAEWTCGDEGVELDIYNHCPQIAEITSVDVSRNYCDNPVLVLQ